MPWQHCSAELSDEVANCPSCGQDKQSWTVEFQVTRTFRVTRRPTVRFELVARDGAPIDGAEFRVTLPDGEVVEGRTDEFGAARVAAPQGGTCRVVFPGRRGVQLVGGGAAGPSGAQLAVGEGKRTFREGSLRIRVHGAGPEGEETQDWEEEEEPALASTAPDGERVAPGRIEGRANDPLAAAEAAAEYGRQVLGTVWEIRQDRDDTDCGPTCVAFLRYGGIRCEGPPRHLLRGWAAGRPDERDEARVRGTDVQRLASQIRAETQLVARDHNRGEVLRDHQVGLSVNEMREALREWARVFRGRIANFELDAELLNAPDQPFPEFARALERRLRARLGLNAGQQRRRGVVVHYVTVSRNGPLPSEQLERSGSIYGTYHWCVITDVRTDGAPRFGRRDGSPWDSGVVLELHNPGPGCGYETWDLHEFALMHRASPTTASSCILYETQEPLDQTWHVRAGDVVCELDAGLLTWGVTLNATAEGELLDYDGHADARAEELARAERTTVAVVERPQGVYHVVKTDCADLSDGLFEAENAQRRTTPDSYGDAVERVGFAAQAGVASVWIYARRVTDAGAEEFRWFGVDLPSSTRG